MCLFKKKNKYKMVDALPNDFEVMYKVFESKKYFELSVKVPFFKKILDSSEIVNYMSRIFVLNDKEIASLSRMRRQELRNMFYCLAGRFDKVKYKK